MYSDPQELWKADGMIAIFELDGNKKFHICYFIILSRTRLYHETYIFNDTFYFYKQLRMYEI